MERFLIVKALAGFFACLTIADDSNDGATEAHDENWAYQLILDNFRNSNPWELPKPIIKSPEETQRDWEREREIVKEWSAKTEYQPKRDWFKVPALLRAARSGDSDALYKLSSYIRHNPSWRHRFEIWKTISSNRGADGVATYYSKLIKSREDTRLRRLIQNEMNMVESGVMDLMSEAESGSLEHCFALYRFFSFLTGKGVESRWGDSKEVCAKYLDLSYKSGDSEKVDIAVQNHIIRLGWSSRRGQRIYPHTPDGWNPKFR